jgi:excisionase family DNA binding protein
MSSAQVQIPLAIGVRGLADRLTTSERTIHRLISSGRLPMPSRLGGQLRWRLAEIEGWLAAGMPDRKRWEQIRQRDVK